VLLLHARQVACCLACMVDDKQLGWSHLTMAVQPALLQHLNRLNPVLTVDLCCCRLMSCYAEEEPKLPMGEMSKRLGEMWKQTSDEEKAPFEVSCPCTRAPNLCSSNYHTCCN
jgi:hypothetical protein